MRRATHVNQFGWPHRHYARTDSTNTRARELAAAGAPHGTVVTAGEQTEGRGRQGRSWTAPPGGALLYSAIVRPLDARHALLPLAIPLAVCEAAEELRPGVVCGVKWPNDVQIEGRKLAGVLIEARPQDGWGVIGVGMNLTIAPEEFPPELRESAVSLFGGRDAAKPGIADPRYTGPGAGGTEPIASGPTAAHAAEALSSRLAHWIDAEQASILTAWRERDALRGREVGWEGGSGVADGVDDRGYLVVVAPDGTRVCVGAGEVHLTRS
jgi:BirA family biotin operon repressor/biotin-[acetyl-CoA-carboxylase] ligase